jgi:hypothetical protein
MLPAEAQAVAVKPLIRANDALATVSGDYTSIQAEGMIMVIEDIGDVTGTIAGKLWTASAADGTDATGMIPNDAVVFASRTGPSYQTKKLYDARQNLGFLGYVGTVTTGPIGLCVTAIYRPKTTT